jgi:hypothetical protein
MAQHKWIRICTLCVIIVLSVMASASWANEKKAPCDKITVACKNAGFVQGGASEGTKLL